MGSFWMPLIYKVQSFINFIMVPKDMVSVTLVFLTRSGRMGFLNSGKLYLAKAFQMSHLIQPEPRVSGTFTWVDGGTGR